MRKAFKSGQWEDFKKMLPDESLYNDVVLVLNGQDSGRVSQQSMVAENFLLAAPQQYFLVEKMTKKQKEKKEDIVMALKKKKKDFKNRYGKDAESVMYATATKQAMLPEELSQQTDDIIRKSVKQMLASVVARIPELNLPNITPDEKAALAEPLVDAIASQISRKAGTAAAAEKESAPEDTEKKESEDIESKLEEMSAMAGGAVAGHSSSPRIGEYDNE